MNKYPLWKNILLLLILVVAIIYASPMLFGEIPAVQISSTTAGLALDNTTLDKVKSSLQADHLGYKSVEIEGKMIVVRFENTDEQLKGQAALKEALGDQYIVALNLEAATPHWLQAMGANPMKLGLDLRGGVHFLFQIDTDSVVKSREKAGVRSISEELRSKHIRYAGIAPLKTGGISVRFRDEATMNAARALLEDRFAEFDWKMQQVGSHYLLNGTLSRVSLQKIEQYAIDQTMTKLRRRVNELGVSEAIVQQQGIDRISVDLPGIQDAAQAKNILGKTATLEFYLVDTQHDAGDAVGGLVPSGTMLMSYDGMPLLLKNRLILSGASITNASAGFDSQSGRPSVDITLGGGGEALFERVTEENVGNGIATVYTETRSEPTLIDGKEKIVYKQIRRVINVATIQSALGVRFQVTGLSSPEEARNLAMLLRAGALPAAITIVEERTVGPSMGQENINKGMLSVFVGTGLVILFMMLYYRFFGFVADMGLLINLVFLIAILSAIGATLTFAGIAGIVLTMGMAIDANVLIYERIREELRNGVTSQVAIHAGYERAFVTIVDANVTTLIVALILFALGSGAVKGFAITLTIGLLTSMLSAVTFTRAIVNLVYGGRRLKGLSIGIKVRK